MSECPNLAETRRGSKIRKVVEGAICVLLLFGLLPISLKQDEAIFHKYMRDFNKSYENDTIYQRRFEAFKAALKHIELLNFNKTLGSATYGLTKYSDLYPEEFLESLLTRRIESIPSFQKNKRSLLKYSPKLPNKVDYREKNVVNDISQQGSCGACYAFSVIGIIESMYAIKTGNLTKLSVQQMIDCSKYNSGCDGGDVCNLLEWIYTDNVKIVSEDIYPLYLKTQKCQDVNSSSGIKIADFNCNNFVNQEYRMLYLLAHNGPLAVGINAMSWQHYIGGTIKYHCDNTAPLNHAVQIVGFDLTASVPQYIVKNSWGKDFGEDGYLYIGLGENLCGIAQEVASVKIF